MLNKKYTKEFVMKVIEEYLQLYATKRQFDQFLNLLRESDYYSDAEVFAKAAFKKSRLFKTYFYERSEEERELKNKIDKITREFIEEYTNN
ncbi:hypothetical protein ACIQVU_07835 [Lysinibacillus sp. NPDC098008]|uniref:hypothetical protein n=1 Tax=Lysinibacillus sp. NPDC098008 TaxID=3364146 RepID=UPI0037F327C2